MNATESVGYDKCTTTRCRGQVVLTHLSKGLCQKCWDKHCAREDDLAHMESMQSKNDDDTGSTVDAENMEPADSTAGEAAANEEANNMATATATRKKGKSKGKGKGKKKTAAKAAAPKLKVAAAPKDKKLSAIDAAAQVLKKARKPMKCKDMIDEMEAQELWVSPGGLTPWATLYSAIIREIVKGYKDGPSRFNKTERGSFEHSGV